MKGKGEASGSMSQRYRPASEYDDATLAQKREYWRTKKREQRARLSEKRGRVKQDSRVEKSQHLNAPAASNSSTANSLALSYPLQNNDESHKSANLSPTSQSGKGTAGSSVETSQSQKEKWLKTIKLSKVLPEFAASSSISAKTARVSEATGKSPSAEGAVSRSVTSPRPSGTLFNTSSSVPPNRVTRMTITNGSSAKTTPQPCVSMQVVSVPKARQKTQIAVCIQPKPLPTSVTTGVMLVSSPSAPAPIKIEGKAANTAPQTGKKSALVDIQKAKGVGNMQPSLETEEERAAKRREQWRIKKREQRARLAARLAKTRERTQSAEVTLQRQTLPRGGQSDGMVLEHLPSPSFLRGTGQRQCFSRARGPHTSSGRFIKNARVMVMSSAITKHTSTAVKQENDNLQSGAANLTTVNLNQNQQAVQIKVEGSRGNEVTQRVITSDVSSEKKPGEPTRKFLSCAPLYNASRGFVRCRTPRQRFIEAQKGFVCQRTIRGKLPSHASVFITRNVAKIDPNATPEQAAARRREYWRIKKREQRAKLSVEVKARLKEKDSLMRRVKRYQKILEEMRKARAEACSTVTQPTGSTLTHASETIGGFIKEDGTVTINIPQAPTDRNTAANKTEEEVHPLSNNTTQQQQQSHAKLGGNATKNVVLVDPIRVNRPPPPLRPAQVKVSFPLAGQSVNKPPRLLSIRPRTQLESKSTTISNSQILAVQTTGQLTLTHPQTLQNTVSGVSTGGSNLGGCVMKMAVSSSASSLSALSLDPELTEEERMAKKREYWRIKKREQRAARAARLKQGVLQARANAALQRRKIQKLTPPQRVAVTNITPSRDVSSHTRTTPNTSVPITPQANEIKQENESTPAADLNSPPEQAICPDIKPPPSPPPPPAPLPEPDPALSADNQATTLLAVASMKKLLEESLSTVTEFKSEPTGAKTEHLSCKMEVEACVAEQEKPDLPQLSLRDEEEVPVAADLTLQIKSWQGDTDPLAPASSPTSHLKNSTESSVSTLPPHPTSEHSSQTPSYLSLEASDGSASSSPRRAQRLRAKKVGHQHCCSPEPPKLHHPPLDHQHPQQEHCEQQCQPLQHGQKNSSLTMQQQQQQQQHAVTEQSSMSSLQKKREYWKLMKRQQRARSKARQKERQGECSRRLSPKDIQAPGLVIINAVKGVSPPVKATLQPKPSTATLTAVTSIPTVLVISPTTSSAGQSPDTLQVKPPISSVSCSPEMHAGSSQTSHSFSPVSDIARGDSAVSLGNGMDGRLLLVENQQEAVPGSSSDQPRVRKWTLEVPENTDIDSVPSLPTLKPPDNPLSSINLQAIEPLGQTPKRISTLSPIKIPCAQSQSPQNMLPTPTKLAPISTMVPPKPIPGESEEDFLKRKREYWRVKKKEQRARKAIRDRELTQRKASNNWRPILPAQGVDTQDSGQWVNSSEESEQLMSTSPDADLGYFPYSTYTAPIEDESELLFADYEGAEGGEDGPVSDTVWRNRYLMDYDPLNQLLVCMVCGELQYSHSLEGVRAHIDEAHPDTLSMDAGDRRCILEAWDEQVSRRERFFTSQLQQHSGALAESHRN
ncbi:uncharacterized protein LOC115377000 [Myripristis murdjan]|uniref:uncharacterized protein LOC115377000 n=1 Tax=Myripristis murdjan TaxID=586833 RepID=UPI001175E555|nr:uncharacterized protein LOC115377000 [Myripristis murdjan]